MPSSLDPSNSAAATGAGHILVVDDEPSIVEIIRLNLEQQGFAVDTAPNAVIALQKLVAERPRLLITDIMMPEMDGYDLMRHVRDEPELAGLPIIVLTARTADRDVTTGYDVGADLYLTKPINPSELLAFVRRLLPPSDRTETPGIPA